MNAETMNKRLNNFADRLENCRITGQTICLMPHVNVDGDAIGSCLALLLALEQLGNTVLFPLDEPVPPKLTFLPACDRIQFVGSEAEYAQISKECIAVLIDCSDCQRTGNRATVCEQASERWVIDHHVIARPVQDQDIIDPTAAASAEIVYDFIQILENKSGLSLINHDVATLLMTALISDTGGFVFSNTSERSFRMAAKLMNETIDLQDITYRLFRQSSFARLRLMGTLFSEARFFNDQRVVIASVLTDQMEAYQATDDDLDGIINQLRNVTGVDLAIVFRQQKDGTIRVNIRSSALIDASALARHFDGGGHPRAAGMTLKGLSLPEAETVVLQKAGEQL